jgi:L-ascorbate metabolism protein UlaG (beta-lactamase superfamily)
MVPHGKNADDLRQIIVEKSGMITAMSVGLRGHRVVIPPHYDGVTPPTRALADFAQLARSNNERLLELFERAQAAVALARRSASATPR